MGYNHLVMSLCWQPGNTSAGIAVQWQTRNISRQWSGETQYHRYPVRTCVLWPGNRAYLCQRSEAKGPVERANQTLQDRQIKEMRLEGITGIEAANAWLATFIADFNSRFSRPAKFPKDLHRSVQESPNELKKKIAVLPVRKLKCWIIPMAPSPSTMSTGALSARHLISWPVSTRQIVDNKRLGTVLRLAQVKQVTAALIIKLITPAARL